MTEDAAIRAFRDYGWQAVERRPYKQDAGAPFRDISRQVLFDEAELGCELRYFDMAPGGYSTLERHQHMHGVMVFRGHGHCLLGTEVRPVRAFDLVTIPAWTWHQFRATGGVAFGFLCMVNRDRDRPQVPTAADLSALREVPAVAAFLDGLVR